MSLTVSGQVTRSILDWNDGDRLRNVCRSGQHPQSSRFTFSGAAKISPNLTAGFELMTEWTGAGRPGTVDQRTRIRLARRLNIVAGADGGLLSPHSQLVPGRQNLRPCHGWPHRPRGPVATIDLGGISTVASASPSLVGGGFVVDGSADFIRGTRLAALVGPSYGGDRGEGVRWDSNSIGGFVLQASWAEEDVWTVGALRRRVQRLPRGGRYRVLGPDTESLWPRPLIRSSSTPALSMSATSGRAA